MQGFFGQINIDSSKLDKNQLVNLINIRDSSKNKLFVYKEDSYYLCYSNDCSFFINDIGKIKTAILLFGRLDNRSELLDKYKLSQPSIRDEEIILWIYEHHGEKYFYDLIGAFSFIIFDLSNKKIIAAKDHIGMKPLFYKIEDNCLSISSHIKLIRQMEVNPAHLNRERVIYYLTYISPYDGSTFYKNIYRLRSSHYLKIENSLFTLKKYFKFKVNNKLLIKNTDQSKELKKLIEKVIKIFSDRHQRMSSKLSGGLDSSTLSAVLLKCKEKENINLFSVIFQGLENKDFSIVDESEYMNSFCMEKNIENTLVKINGIDEVDPFLYDYADDEPSIIINRYFDIAVLKEASNFNFGHILDGFDGDSVIDYGKNYLSDLGKTYQFKKLFEEKSKLEKNGFRKMGNLNFFLRYAVKPNLPIFILKIFRIIFNKKTRPDINYSYLSNQTKKTYALKEIKNKLDIKDTYSYENASQLHEDMLNWPVWEHLLEISNRDSNKFGIEELYPFLDRRIMELSLNIHPDQKLRNGWTRQVLRKAFKSELPKKISRRSTKSNIAPAIDNFFEKLKERKNYLNSLVGPDSVLDGLISKSSIKELYESNKSEDNQLLYQLISLERWMVRNNFKWKE